MLKKRLPPPSNEEAIYGVPFGRAVSFWKKRRWKVRLFVCPQIVRRKGESSPHPCSVINCPEFLADLQHKAVIESEREEFIRLNKFDPDTLLKRVPEPEMRPSDLRSGNTKEMPSMWEYSSGEGADS